jgi:trimethylamine--corrinoid protein Co-methyltransferase
MGSQDGYLSRQLFAMAAMVAGGEDELRARPLISWVTCPVSPLKLTRESCEIITEAARCGIVVNILSMAMAGGSSPVTLAGTLVTHNAEVLAGVTLAQLVERGAPVIYGSSTTALDLRLAAASVGSPECALISSAVAQLARFYLLPSWVAGL